MGSIAEVQQSLPRHLSSAQALHARVGFGLLGVSTVLLALLGLSAWWLCATLPLDVALDDHGVTFAGTARPWGSISRFERRVVGGGAAVRLYSAEGDITIGPGSARVIDDLLRALAARMVGRGAT